MGGTCGTLVLWVVAFGVCVQRYHSVYYASRHLIFPGCSPEVIGSGIEFWKQLHASIVEAFADDGMPFDTIHCPANKAEEKAAVDAIVSNFTRVHKSHALLITSAIFPHLCFPKGSVSDCPDPFDAYSSFAGTLSMGANVTHFWIEAAPTLGITQYSSLTFIPNNHEGGVLVGEAYCNRVHSSRRQSIAVLYGDINAQHSFDRIEGFEQAMQAECPRHSIVYRAHADWSREKAKKIASLLFLRDSSIHTIVCASDSMALGVIDAALQYRADGVSGLIVLGFDNTLTIRPHVASGTVPVTIDMLSAHKDNGLSFQIRKAVGFIDIHANSAAALNTADLVALLGLKRGSTRLESRVMPFVTNMGQYLTARIFDSYDSASRPFHRFNEIESATSDICGMIRAPTIIDSELYVTYLAIKAASFEIEGMLQLSWDDPRLQYYGLLPHGCLSKLTLPRAVEFWKPNIFVENSLGVQSIFPKHEAGQDGEYLAEVYPDGKVVWTRKISLELTCSMDYTKLPYDEQKCEFSLGSFSQDAKDVQVRWADIAEPVQVAKPSLSEWQVQKVPTHVELDRGYAFAHATFIFERKSGYYSSYVVLPNYLFVLIAWCSFFVARSSAPARAGMTLICFLASSGQVAAILTMIPKGVTSVWLLNLLLVSRYFILYAIVEYSLANFLVRIENREKNGIVSLGKHRFTRFTRFFFCCRKTQGGFIIKGHHLDIFSRFAFPVAYAIVVISFSATI